MERKLGAFETAQVRTNNHFAFNLVLTLRLTEGPTPEKFADIIRVLQSRHPLLQARLEIRNKSYFYVRDTSLNIPVTILPRKNPSDWREFTEKELSTPFDLDREPLFRAAYLFNPAQEKSEAILTFQHSIADAETAGHFAEELMTLFLGKETATAEQAKEETFPPPADALFPPAFKGTSLIGKLALFLLRQIRGEIAFRRGRRGIPPPPIHSQGNCRILTLSLDREISDSLILRSRKERVTLNSLFSAALLTSVQSNLYNSAGGIYRHFYTADLRPYLKPPVTSTTMGSYFSMMRMPVSIEPTPEFWPLARTIQKISLESLKSGDKFLVNLMTDFMMKRTFRTKSERMGTTGLSYTSPFSLPREGQGCRLDEFHALVSNFTLGPEYTAFVRMFKERFIWDILYLDSDMDRRKAEKIAGDIKAILYHAVETES